MNNISAVSAFLYGWDWYPPRVKPASRVVDATINPVPASFAAAQQLLDDMLHNLRKFQDTLKINKEAVRKVESVVGGKVDVTV